MTGYTMRTVAQLVGHDTGTGVSMTSMYAGEEPWSAKAEAIGAIRAAEPLVSPCHQSSKHVVVVLFQGFHNVP